MFSTLAKKLRNKICWQKFYTFNHTDLAAVTIKYYVMRCYTNSNTDWTAIISKLHYVCLDYVSATSIFTSKLGLPFVTFFICFNKWRLNDAQRGTILTLFLQAEFLINFALIPYHFEALVPEQ